MSVTDAQIDFFRTHGYLAVPDLIPRDRLAAMRRSIEELCGDWQSERARQAGVMQEPGAAGEATPSSQTVRKLAYLVPQHEVFRSHVADAALLDIVQALIGAPISLYADQALLKPPRYGSEKPFHQDNAYFRVEPDDAVVTCWAALDDADVENGCMHYIPGSQRLGRVDHTLIENTPHLVPEGVDPRSAVAVPIGAGGCIFHHSLILHMSPPNRTDRWRRAFVAHFVRSDAATPARAAQPPMLQLR